MRLLGKACAVAAVAACSIGSAEATVLTVGGGWSAFTFGAVGSSFSSNFTFTLTSNAVFNVTDAYLDGDQFLISINGGASVLTSTPVNDGTQVNDNFDAAFASPKYSHASYLLSAGVYTITGTVAVSPFGGGGAAAELVRASAVPEPTSWAMMIGGFGFVGAAMRRKRTAVTFA